MYMNKYGEELFGKGLGQYSDDWKINDKPAVAVDSVYIGKKMYGNLL